MLYMSLNKASKLLTEMGYWLNDRGFLLGRDVRYHFDDKWIVWELPDSIATEFKLRFA
jgi:hypothetical protein